MGLTYKGLCSEKMDNKPVFIALMGFGVALLILTLIVFNLYQDVNPDPGMIRVTEEQIETINELHKQIAEQLKGNK